MTGYIRHVRLLLGLIIILACACATERHAGRVRDSGPKPEPTVRIHEMPEKEINAVQSEGEEAPVDALSTSNEASLSIALPLTERGTNRARQASQLIRDEEHTAAQEQENLMPKKKWNRLAIPAFVAAAGTVYLGLSSVSAFAVIGAILVTLALAGISLKRIRTHEQAGKGFAFAALMIGVIATLLTALTIAYYGVE